MGRDRRSRRDDDRGAVAVLTGALMVVLLTVSAFVVDIGMQRVTRSDMQALADVVSLDLARHLDGTKTAAQLTSGSPSQLQTWANQSLARNRDNVGGQAAVTPVPGTIDAAGTFKTVTGTTVPTAIKVDATASVKFSFGGITGVSKGSATRSAVATAAQGACFTVGSYAARLNTGDSTILGPLLGALGSNVTLSVLEAGQLANADVTLLQLVNTGLIAATPEGVLGTTVRLRDFYLAVADVLIRESGQTAQVALLQRLANATLGTVTVKLADLVSLDTGSSAGLNGAINVFDLVTAGAFLANGTNAVALPNVGVNIAGVSALKASVIIGEKPQIACGLAGRAKAATSQVQVRLTGNLVNLNLGLISVSSPLDIVVNVASAEGTLTSVACLPTQKTIGIQPSAGVLDLDINLALNATVLFIPIVNAPVRVYTTRTPTGTSSTPFTLGIPINAQNPTGQYGAQVHTTGANGLGLPALQTDTSKLTLLGLPLGQLTSLLIDPLVSTVLTPLVQTLDAVLLTPLLKALGINVGGADYRSAPVAECNVPQLRG